MTTSSQGKARRIIVPREGILPVYRPYLCAPQRTQLFFGGAGSGKSVFLATRAVLDALTGRNTLVVRQVQRTLRHSAFNELRKAMHRFGLQEQFLVSLSDLAMTCTHSGAQILCLGLNDVEKIKSITPQRGVLTDIWVEEATECRYKDLKQLEKRLRGQSAHRKRLSLSFNPVHKGHWLFRTYFSSWPEGQRLQVDEELLILRTSYLDNPFLTEDDRAAYAGEKDSYFHRVYTMGEWGELSGAVFTGWRAADLSQRPVEGKQLRFGLDFGFAKDPCAALKLMYDAANRRILVLEELRLHGVGNAQLAERLRAFAGRQPIICDSAEPKSIAELRAHGIRAIAARKGADSLRHGLQWLQAREILVDQRCRGLMAELHNYRWRQDAAGESLPVPEGEDHLLDAMRYALEMDMQGRFAEAQGKVV